MKPLSDIKNIPMLSLCIPTNGVIEWVFPVLDSIFSQGVDKTKYEVIVTDNGDNIDFKNKILEYTYRYDNLHYQENNSFMFHNQLEALKLANGLFLKFVNHRAPFVDGALEKMISIIEENSFRKPTLYFSNGCLKEEHVDCTSFDGFVSELGIYASWTTGVGIWKEEYERVKDSLVVDNISPHSCILFSRKNDELYRIYNYTFSKELTTNHSQKGSYDLFKAFGIEELAITQNLYINNYISIDTFKKVKSDYCKFLASLYYKFCIRKEPCSYDLSGFEDSMGIYFSKQEIKINAYKYGILRLINRIKRKGRK